MAAIFPKRGIGHVAILAGALWSVGGPAAAVEWSGVQGKTVTLFYTGQASWEWALTVSDHSGATKFREGKTCVECHAGEEKDIGGAIVAGKRLEPKPIANKRATIPTEVKFAHDGDKLYVRLEFPDAPPTGGQKLDPDYPVKVTMMFDDGKISEATRAACWGSCHDAAAGMASGDDKRTKYLGRTRVKVTRKGGGDDLKPKAEIDAMMADGQFLEYWQAALKPNAPATAVDGTLLAARAANKAPAVAAEGRLEGGKWVVTLSRKLQSQGPGHKAITPGKVYAVGFAIHDNHTAGRLHHVSLNYTFAIDAGKADFVAMKK